MEWQQENGGWWAQGQRQTYRITRMPDIRPHFQLSMSDGSFGGAYPTVEEARHRADELEQNVKRPRR